MPFFIDCENSLVSSITSKLAFSLPPLRIMLFICLFVLTFMTFKSKPSKLQKHKKSRSLKYVIILSVLVEDLE